jgi:hypothetical protein
MSPCAARGPQIRNAILVGGRTRGHNTFGLGPKSIHRPTRSARKKRCYDLPTVSGRLQALGGGRSCG